MSKMRKHINTRTYIRIVATEDTLQRADKKVPHQQDIKSNNAHPSRPIIQCSFECGIELILLTLNYYLGETDSNFEK